MQTKCSVRCNTANGVRGDCYMSRWCAAANTQHSEFSPPRPTSLRDLRLKNTRGWDQGPLPATPQDLDVLPRDQEVAGAYISIWFQTYGVRCIMKRSLVTALGPKVCMFVSEYSNIYFQNLFLLVCIFNPFKTQRRLLYLKTRCLPSSKHFSSRL
jgi:hypothetical protein